MHLSLFFKERRQQQQRHYISLTTTICGTGHQAIGIELANGSLKSEVWAGLKFTEPLEKSSGSGLFAHYKHAQASLRMTKECIFTCIFWLLPHHLYILRMRCREKLFKKQLSPAQPSDTAFKYPDFRIENISHEGQILGQPFR